MTERRRVRLSVDPDVCAGSGNCVFWAANVFELDPSGISVVIGDPSQADAEDLAVAVEGCPTGAISLEYLDEADGEGANSRADEGQRADRAV